MSITYIEPADLRSGSITDTFQRGAAAIVLKNDSRIAELWSRLVAFDHGNGRGSNDEVLPWDGSVLDLERNFVPGLSLADEVGDSIHARPGHLTYIARKIAIQRRAGSDEIDCSPETFYTGERQYRLDRKVLGLAWQVASDVLGSFSARTVSDHVAVHRLRYVSSFEELGRRIAMVAKAFGGGSGHGLFHRLESGPGAAEYLIAVLRRYPLLARTAAFAPECLLRALGLQLGRSDNIILGNAHTDPRVFSGLIADRSNVHTEIWAEGRWQRLPMTKDQMVILPGRTAQRLLGIKPTWHRILLAQGERSEMANAESTLLIGAG